MITLYSGTPRSGKSLHAARTIINWSRSGSPVICNFECDLSKYKKAKFTYLPNYELVPKTLIQISRDYFKDKEPKESSLLLVIDEAQLLFNAREWNKPNQKEWVKFFSQHGKLGYDIIMIAQFDRMLDRQIRSLFEYEFKHRKMANFGWKGKLFSFFCGGKSIMVVKCWYPIQEKVSSEIMHVKKMYYEIYDTFKTFEDDSGAAADAGLGVPRAAVPEKGLNSLENENKENNNIA